MAACPAHGQDAQKKDGGVGVSPAPHLVPRLTYIWSFLSWPLEALAMSCLGPEAGYIIVALTSVPFAAFLLTTKPKLLVFIASFGIGTGEKNGFTGYPKPCKSWWILCPNNTLSILSVSRHYCPLESHHWPYIPTQQTPQASSSIYRFNYQSRKTKQGPGKLWKASLF